jgi:hypothetical protein
MASQLPFVIFQDCQSSCFAIPDGLFDDRLLGRAMLQYAGACCQLAQGIRGSFVLCDEEPSFSVVHVASNCRPKTQLRLCKGNSDTLRGR